jgi:hypothetical protein
MPMIKLKPTETNSNTPQKVPTLELKPNTTYKPYGEYGPDVYYSQENDQYIIKNGNERILVDKGSEKYNDIDQRLTKIALHTITGQGECPDYAGGCKKNREAYYRHILKKPKDQQPSMYDKVILDDEGDLAEAIDGYYHARVVGPDGKPVVERIKGESFMEKYDDPIHEELKMTWSFISENQPKSKRFTIYKPFGDENISLLYDNNTGVIMKEDDEKITSETGKPMTRWTDIPIYSPKYKELKSLIDGVNYKKEKGTKNTFVPISPNFDPMATPDWMKNK